MKKRLFSFILFLSLIVSVVPVSATEQASNTEAFSKWSEGLDSIMADYMEEHGLNEDNFSMGYLYTGTGEYWYTNKDRQFRAGSTYKVPLNMRITEKVLAGELSWDDYVSGLPLPEAQKMSITYSSNPISHELQRYLVDYQDGYYAAYRGEISKYFTDDPSSLPDNYYYSANLTAEYLLKTLVCLYNDSELYSDIIKYMTEASPGQYFRKYEGDYTIAHKYGSYEGFLNDMAIVYTPTPFFLVVMTERVDWAENILGELCQLMTEYTLELDAAYLELEAAYEEERQAAIAEAAAQAEALETRLANEAAAARAELQMNLLLEELEAVIQELASAAAISTLRFALP